MPDYSKRTEVIDRLLFMHGLMVASEPLMEMAIVYLKPGPVRNYVVKHREEERDHAGWLAADLASAGVVPPTVHWRAAELAGTQAYLIQFVAPEMLLGYMAALESDPMPMTQVAQLEHWHGAELFRTLRYHAEHDVQHRIDLQAIIRTLDQPTLELVVENFNRTREKLT